MDSDLLRMVLIILGVALVVGIYLWDKFKRADGIKQMKMPSKSTPSMEAVEFSIDGDGSDDFNLDEDSDLLPFDESVGEPVVVHKWDQNNTSEEDSEVDYDLTFNAQGDDDYLNSDPSLLDEAPRKIIQLTLMAKNEGFSLTAIQDATNEVEMILGEMDIYHRELDDGSGRVLFSLASMVEPGTFPKKDANFITPGLVMFSQLPGVRDGMVIFSDLLFSAERMATLLDADLCDETRSVLTKQTIEHLREGVLEHRRQVQLSRSQ